MNRYHVNPETGNPNICRAVKGGCPFGGEEAHFDSKNDARKAFERFNSANGAPKLKKRVSNIDPRHGYLKREIAEGIVIHDVNCQQCGEPLGSFGARAMISEEYAECDCGFDNDLEKLQITLTPKNPSYKFLDKNEVKKATWYHATDKDNWLEEIEVHDEKDSSEHFLAHIGTEAAAFDRAITNYAPHRDWQKLFYIYEVALAEDATIADEIPQDENKDSSLKSESDVVRYINRWEDMASISLAVRSNKLRIIGKRLVKPKEAHERLTPYNIPSPEEVEDY